MLQLELSRACPVFLSCLSLLIKRPFIIQITARIYLFVMSTVATQFTAHPTVQITFLQTKCMTLLTVDTFPHSWYLYFVLSDFIEFNISFVFEWYHPKTDTNWNIKCFLLGEIRKIFQSTRVPTRWLIFHSVTSVPLLKFLYLCPVFRSNLVLFIFQSDWMVLFLFLFPATCLIFLWSNLQYVFRSIHKRWPHVVKNCC